MIIAALVLPVTLGIAALAVEGGVWYADHHQLRNMADAAALAAGWARRDGTDEQAAADDAVPDVGYNEETDEVFLISPPETGPYAGDNLAIEVVARRTRPLVMSTLFMEGNAVDIEARAIVRLQSQSSYCVLALHPTAAEALRIVGSANLNLVNCGVNVNSNAVNALTMVGNAYMNVAWAEITGGISMSGGAEINSVEEPETGVAPRQDPYADVSISMPGGCAATNLQVNANQTITLNPGRYCGGMTINSKAKVTFNPGTYYIDGGTLQFNGGSTVTGTGVTLALTGSPGNYATATINGGAKVTLSAPTSGDYAGIALMQDRHAPTGPINKFNGGSTMNISGAVYFPTQQVEFEGGNSTGMGCTRLIAWTIKFAGNATMGDNCSVLGLPEGLPDDPELVG
jgi:hypothetical protein